jgi:hypothetical protein
MTIKEQCLAKREEIKLKYPSFEVVDKETSKLMKFLNVFVWLFNRRFMRDYTTTVLGKLYMPVDLQFTEYELSILDHEEEHLRQSKMLTPVLFNFSYLFVLPAVFTFRAYFEYKAFLKTLEYKVRKHGKDYTKLTVVPWIIKQFTGPSYLFMFPFAGFLERKMLEYIDNLKE